MRERSRHGSESRGPATLEFRRKLGEKGWFGLNWPVEYGGLGLGPVYQHILVHEFEYVGAPGPDLTVTSVAPMIMRNGTEQNKDASSSRRSRAASSRAPSATPSPTPARTWRSLPTPGPGSTATSGSSTARRSGTAWRSAPPTSGCACAPIPHAPKHRGISVIMVPIDTPGIEIRPLITWADFRTNETFFTDVRVPRTNLIGEVNRGWQYITGALDLERGALTNAGDLRRAVDDLIELARRAAAGRHAGRSTRPRRARAGSRSSTPTSRWRC